MLPGGPGAQGGPGAGAVGATGGKGGVGGAGGSGGGSGGSRPNWIVQYPAGVTEEDCPNYPYCFREYDAA